jgi:hypothetical protein
VTRSSGRLAADRAADLVADGQGFRRKPADRERRSAPRIRRRSAYLATLGRRSFTVEA